MKSEVLVPLTVSSSKKNEFVQNYNKATLDSGNLFLFAGDQKIEHLNKDFYGDGISQEDNNPKHMFEIAAASRIGAFATQLGLVARYGADYKDVNYVIKLNSKTDLVSAKQAEPISVLLNDVYDVVQFKSNSGLSIVGVGYTIYLGSEHEAEMLSEASQVVFDAHQNGLLAILWIYPRGKSIENEKSSELIAGAAGVAACLGADFVKVNPPESKDGLQSAKELKVVTVAAGRTKVVCSGGTKKDEKEFLEDLHRQINVGGASGCAVGRNIHQRDLNDAIQFCEEIAKVVFEKLK